MELRHLRYFVAVAEELNFSRAARRLHVSQPPLSRQIKDLEQELGVELLERSRKGLRLTRAGEHVFKAAQHILQESEALAKEAQRLVQLSRRELRIGYIAHVHGALVIETATLFRKAHRDVTVRVFDLTTAEQVDRLCAGEIDLGFVGFSEGPLQERLVVERIGTTYAVMALPRSHPLVQRKPLPLALFKSEPFVTVQEAGFPGTREYVLRFCAQAGFCPRIIHEAAQPVDVLNVVAIGEAVALVPERMRRLPHPGVVFCDLAEPVPRLDSFVAWRHGTTVEWLGEFVAAAKESYTRMARLK